jgi:hypothetical protein
MINPSILVIYSQPTAIFPVSGRCEIGGHHARLRFPLPRASRIFALILFSRRFRRRLISRSRSVAIVLLELSISNLQSIHLG